MSSTLTAPPTDRSMWRKLLRRCHPDAGGDHDLFIWADALRDHVAGDAPEPSIHQHPRRTTTATSPRVPFPDHGDDFDALTRRALRRVESVPGAFSWLLELLVDCYPSHSGRLLSEQRYGASYKRLAAIGHMTGMDKAERSRWYEIARTIPLSERHASHILARIKGGT